HSCPFISDVKFLVGASRRPFAAHRCILSVRCDAFRSMLAEARAGRRQSTSESASSASMVAEQPQQLVLAETNPEAFAAVLEFVYTNCVTLRPQTALSVLACAVEYRLEDLKRLCCEYLTDSLSSQNACELLQAGSSFGLPELRQRAGDFIERNAAAVVKSRGFAGLSADTLAGVLASDQLMLDELEVVAAVRDWAAAGGGNGSPRTPEETRAPVRQLRLGLLSPQELAEVEAENDREFRLIP
uniref:BTB domain-containing protein n=1 Tax=Macrostomum lignano TaxID=282301 RepID=A0A1I8HJN9_9PLAT